jgi:hypothetical protein
VVTEKDPEHDKENFRQQEVQQKLSAGYSQGGKEIIQNDDSDGTLHDGDENGKYFSVPGLDPERLIQMVRVKEYPVQDHDKEGKLKKGPFPAFDIVP